MKTEQEILVLKNKQTEDLAVYNLIEDNYNIIFGNNISQIPYYEGFELLLTSQYEVNFCKKSDLDWLIDILNPDQYEKVSRKTDILYKKHNISYMSQDTKNDYWLLDYDLIWSVFETKFGYNYQLFKDLTKGILLEVYKCKVVTTKCERFKYYVNC
jgi:hypothetical protein